MSGKMGTEGKMGTVTLKVPRSNLEWRLDWAVMQTVRLEGIGWHKDNGRTIAHKDGQLRLDPFRWEGSTLIMDAVYHRSDPDPNKPYYAFLTTEVQGIITIAVEDLPNGDLYLEVMLHADESSEADEESDLGYLFDQFMCLLKSKENKDVWWRDE